MHPTIWLYRTKFQTCRNNINQSAATQSAGSTAADDVTDQSSIQDMCPGNSTSRRPHAHGDARTFKRRSGSGGCAKHSFAIAHDHFTIRAKVHQCRQFAAFMQTGGNDSSKDIGADKPSEARQEFNDCR